MVSATVNHTNVHDIRIDIPLRSISVSIAWKAAYGCWNRTDSIERYPTRKFVRHLWSQNRVWLMVTIKLGCSYYIPDAPLIKSSISATDEDCVYPCSLMEAGVSYISKKKVMESENAEVWDLRTIEKCVTICTLSVRSRFQAFMHST